jgi:CRISPR/Cas system CSM-associated protein Csm2 small subunit
MCFSSYAQEELTEPDITQECERQGKEYELKGDDLVDFFADCIDELTTDDEELEEFEEDSSEEEQDEADMEIDE